MSKIKGEFYYQLSNYGWYISANMRFMEMLEIFQSINEGKFYEKENSLFEYYKSNLKALEKNLLSKHKDRIEILTEAFKAHKNKMFHSSTILFISQSDGICNGKIFTGENNKLKFFNLTKSPEFVIQTIGKQSAINEDSRVIISDYFSELNRHRVMHGLTSDYGNEINSLKALSLLCSVSDFVDRYKE